MWHTRETAGHLDNALFDDIMGMGKDIVLSDRFAKAWEVPHHSKDGNIAVHSLKTAEYALVLARWLADHDVSVSERDVVRASLLHDIGMTEDSVFLSPSYMKARSHPREGARIARDEFGANDTQVEAILFHMWPVCCVIPPRSAEGWTVSIADKRCSVHEVGEMSGDVVARVGRWMLDHLSLSRNN